jgi:hypothetical protein
MYLRQLMASDIPPAVKTGDEAIAIIDSVIPNLKPIQKKPQLCKDCNRLLTYDVPIYHSGRLLKGKCLLLQTYFYADDAIPLELRISADGKIPCEFGDPLREIDRIEEDQGTEDEVTEIEVEGSPSAEKDRSGEEEEGKDEENENLGEEETENEEEEESETEEVEEQIGSANEVLEGDKETDFPDSDENKDKKSLF